MSTPRVLMGLVAAAFCSYAELPDIRSVPTDLTLPPVSYGDPAPFRFQAIPYRNHNAGGTLRDISARPTARRWLAQVLRERPVEAVDGSKLDFRPLEPEGRNSLAHGFSRGNNSGARLSASPESLRSRFNFDRLKDREPPKSLARTNVPRAVPK